ncbi:hypothetical protein R50073_17910 [Maricurvus nonylphenolicus]|uniref:hypothetical protein n=1 Tax=Maricurvus nonylphenolicus TaxID=1008307 RepID=UPI0036F40F86
MESAKSYKEHIEKYGALRAAVYSEVPKAINMPGVRLTPINTVALDKYASWPNNNRVPPNGGWDWGSWVSHYRSKHPKRFEAAIWFGSILCGLLLGKMSGKNVHIRLEVLEGSTDSTHPLKGRVAYIALSAVEMYGYALGAKESRIIDPVDGAINSYKKLGYQLFPASKGNPRYLAKSL